MNALDFKTTAEAAEIMGLKKGTLEVWRYQGKGPLYHKIGRLVRYTGADIEAFINGSRRRSTSDTGKCHAETQG